MYLLRLEVRKLGGTFKLQMKVALRSRLLFGVILLACTTSKQVKLSPLRTLRSQISEERALTQVMISR